MAFSVRDTNYNQLLSTNSITVTFGTIFTGLVVCGMFTDDTSAVLTLTCGGASFQQASVVGRCLIQYTTDPTSTVYTLSSSKLVAFLGLIVTRYLGDVGPIVNMNEGYQGSTGTSGSPAPGGVTPVSSDTLFVTTYYGYNAPLSAPPLGYTLDATTGVSSGGNTYNGGMAHLIQTAPVASSPSWSLLTIAGWASNVTMLRPVQSAVGAFAGTPSFTAPGTTIQGVNGVFTGQSAFSGSGVAIYNGVGSFAPALTMSGAGTIPRQYALALADRHSATMKIRDR